MKKILLNLGILSLSMAPMMSLISCSESKSDSDDKIPQNDMIQKIPSGFNSGITRIIKQSVTTLEYIVKKNNLTGTINTNNFSDVELGENAKTNEWIIKLKYSGTSDIKMDSTHNISPNDIITLLIKNESPSTNDHYDKTKFNNMNANDVLKTNLFINENKISISFFGKKFRDKLKLIYLLGGKFNSFNTVENNWKNDDISTLFNFFLEWNTIHAIGKSNVAANNILTLSEKMELIDEISHLKMVSNKNLATTDINQNGVSNKTLMLGGSIATKKYLSAGTQEENMVDTTLSLLIEYAADFVDYQWISFLHKVSYVFIWEESTHTAMGYKYIHNKEDSEKKVIQNIIFENVET